MSTKVPLSLGDLAKNDCSPLFRGLWDASFTTHHGPPHLSPQFCKLPWLYFLLPFSVHLPYLHVFLSLVRLSPDIEPSPITVCKKAPLTLSFTWAQHLFTKNLESSEEYQDRTCDFPLSLGFYPLLFMFLSCPSHLHILPTRQTAKSFSRHPWKFNLITFELGTFTNNYSFLKKYSDSWKFLSC